MTDSNMMVLKKKPGFATVAIRAGQDPEKWNSAAVTPPIVTSATYKKPSPSKHNGYHYSRTGNPTRKTLEECLVALDGGSRAIAFGSGLAAVTAIVNLLQQGDHLLSSSDVYGGTMVRFSDSCTRSGIEVTYTDFTDIELVKAAVKDNTKIIWLETPTNPLMKVVDIAAVVEVARSHGNILVAVDNTFLTPYLQNPLDFGVDIVVYSMSKYINGHTDVIMGAVIVKDEELGKRFKFLQESMGGVPSAFDCYLVNRSLKTLALRMERHMTSALFIAKWLETHPKIIKVMHPGLPSHPQHELMMKQSRGHSGVFSFDHCGNLENSTKFLLALKVITLADSLGGVESLAGSPCVTSHVELTAAQRAELGITDSMVRVSIGLEDPEDLLADVKQALEVAF
ncbi:unnamed protein product [Diatraea saccharalis]|uniref:cystathionine gamma-lyase n=1 Tax=Diatraea saccharalis TaxID=40085 RepID=A0A9N9REX8_9NEOP|nr:unnamed protein product [Diatraea saccharalis]